MAINVVDLVRVFWLVLAGRTPRLPLCQKERLHYSLKRIGHHSLRSSKGNNRNIGEDTNCLPLDTEAHAHPTLNWCVSTYQDNYYNAS